MSVAVYGDDPIYIAKFLIASFGLVVAASTNLENLKINNSSSTF